MEQGVLGSGLAATSWRGFLFFGRLRSSWLSHRFFTVWYVDFKVYSCASVCSTVISHVTLVCLWQIAQVAFHLPLKYYSLSEGKSLRTRKLW